MAVVISIWAIGLLIYFKAIFDAAYRADITIVSTILCAVVATSTIFVVSGTYSLRTLKWNWTPGREKGTVGELMKKTIPSFFLAAVLSISIIRLVIFGFSKKLDREIDFLAGYGSRRGISEEFVTFLAIALAPILLHYAISIAHIASNMKKESE